jgi:hypothetical protein
VEGKKNEISGILQQTSQTATLVEFESNPERDDEAS